MNYERKNCRLCGAGVTPRLILTPTPIANAFAETSDEGATRYNLGLTQCDSCGHVQIGYVIDGSLLFTAYQHYATPPAMCAYLEDCAATMRRKYPKAEFVVEIGSNNGLNAGILRKYFEHVEEVDPGGTSYLCMKVPFTAEFSKHFVNVDLIVANHVFAHIDDLDDVFKGVSLCLADDGALVFEVQYFPDMVRLGAFDMIYHEHRDYHTLNPLSAFARKHGLVLTEYERVPHIQGGSIRVTMKKQGIECALPDESIDWDAFRSSIAAGVENIKRMTAADGVLTHGDDWIVFGAAAKACTLLHHAGIADRVMYAVDDTPAKQGKYIPGTRIKILPVNTLYQSKSTKNLFLAAWNYAEVIKKAHPTFKFKVPFQKHQSLTLNT